MGDNVATEAPTSSSTGAAAPESGERPFQKQQGADRPNEEPSSTEESAIGEKKETAEGAMGGDAESTKSAPRDPDDTSGEPLSSRSKPESGAEEGEKAGGTEKGTGTQYVKSTGLQADGGDFDATAPGAGREADRLLEEKGVHREGNTGPPQETEGASASSGDKPSMGQKVKDALHIGKH